MGWEPEISCESVSRFQAAQGNLLSAYLKNHTVPVRDNRIINQQITLCMSPHNKPTRRQHFLLRLWSSTPLPFLLRGAGWGRLLIEFDNLGRLPAERPQIPPYALSLVLGVEAFFCQRGVVELGCDLSVILWGRGGRRCASNVRGVFFVRGDGQSFGTLFVVGDRGTFDAL